MRFLANENFPEDAVSALRREGHDVVWIRTHAPGSSDRVVLNLAQADNRILITFDFSTVHLEFRPVNRPRMAPIE